MIKEQINIEEGINIYYEKEVLYHQINYKHFEVPKVPYKQNTISPEALRQVLQDLSLKHKDKEIIILALKSSYYLTDEQIKHISKIYGIKSEYIYGLIQHCKETLDKKSTKRSKIQERRNFAYYHHKRYNRMLDNMEYEERTEKYEYFREDFTAKEKKHNHNWNRLNDAFEKGLLYLRPTNKTVANLMGICERQVNYYISSAKKEPKDKKAADDEP